MKAINTIKLILYTTDAGKQPFADWQKRLDKKTESVVITRIGRVKGDNNCCIARWGRKEKPKARY